MKGLLSVILILSIAVGSISSNPVRDHLTATLTKFFGDCERLSGGEEILPQMEQLIYNYTACDTGDFKKFMDTALDYIKGNVDVNIETFLEEGCPSMRNHFTCQRQFNLGASVCYERDEFQKRVKQTDEMAKVIDWICENHGANLIEAREAAVFDCMEENKKAVAACIYVEDTHEKKSPPMIYETYVLRSQIVCGVPKNKACMLEATASCPKHEELGKLIDLITPTLESICPTEYFH